MGKRKGKGASADQAVHRTEQELMDVRKAKAAKLRDRGDNPFANDILDGEPLGVCAQQFPVYGTPRTVAGGPFKGSIFKCELKPVGKAIRASEEEVADNPRARSAVLRIAERLQ